MNQDSQGNNPVAPADVPMKRKRGRPRKHPSLKQGGNARFPRHYALNYAEHGRVLEEQKLNHGGIVHAPPGFQLTNGHQSYTVEPNGDAIDPMVGQVVAGIIEASFGDGYLLNVRVGNSETTLRGVVFKPGCYVPVSAENDVAPHVPVIRRHEMSIPAENYARAHGSHRNGPRSGKGKLVPSVPNPFLSRGNVVPVLLQPTDQPLDLSNGVPLANQPSPVLSQTAHHFYSKPKQLPAVMPKAPREVPKAMLNENSSGSGPPQALHEMGMKSLEMSGMPMEKLLAEVIRRGQSHAQSAPLNDTNTFGNMDQPLTIEPLQAIQPHQQNHSALSTRPFEKQKIGRMTKLLQVVQDRVTDNQAPRFVASSQLANLDASHIPAKTRQQ